MAFFPKSPEKTLQRDRDAAKANVDRLAAKLADAEHAVIASKTAVQRAALDGDDGALDLAETTERAALHRLSTINAASAEASKLLALVESQIAALFDKKLRAATAAECEKMATDLEAVAASFDTAITGLAAISERAATFIFEASGLREYAAASKTQVPDAAAIIGAMLRQHGLAVINGDAPATLRAPEVVVPVVEVPAAPTVQLFALRAVRWKDETGQQQIGGKFSDVFLTKSAAARALATGACVEMSNPLRRKHHGWSTERPQLDHATDLDADPAMQAPMPIEHPSPFTIVDRGGAIQMKVARS